MARISKPQMKLHNQVMDLIHSDKPLTDEEIQFCYENYNEAYGQDISYVGAFFTPFGLANDFELTCCSGGKILDACSGIGMLSYICSLGSRYSDFKREITCVEQNYTYYEIGKRLLPDVNWVRSDIFDFLNQNTEKFDQVISNPPFGKIKVDTYEGDYTGGEFEFKLIDAVKNHCKYGSFILPQSSAGFIYSGVHTYENRENVDRKYSKFVKDTGLKLSCAIGIDTSMYKTEWKNTNIVTEVCDIDYTEFV